MELYPLEEMVLRDHQEGLWYKMRYSLGDSKLRKILEIATPGLECFPKIKSKGASGDYMGPLRYGFPADRDQESDQILYRGILSKRWDLKRVPLSYLICGRFSGQSISQIKKNYKGCESKDCCDLIARNVTKSIMRGLSSRIFSKTVQPYAELIANAVDATGDSSAVGKFGIGFFSALSFVGQKPLAIISMSEKTALHMRIYKDPFYPDDYFFDVDCFNYEGKTGTFIFVDGEFIPHTLYNLKTHKVLVVNCITQIYSVIADSGIGISERTLFDKLLLPSLSTKKIRTYSENKFVVEYHGEPKLTVNNYVIFINSKSKSNPYSLNFSNKYNVPLSRDDLLLGESDAPSVINFLRECETSVLLKWGKRHLNSFLEDIATFSRMTNSIITRKIFLAYLKDENQRHPIKTTIFDKPADPFYYGKTFYIAQTQKALMNHFPGEIINGIYCIQNPQLGMPTNHGYPGLLFYGNPESITPFRIAMKDYSARFSNFLPPVIPILNVIVYVIVEKYKLYKTIDDAAFLLHDAAVSMGNMVQRKDFLELRDAIIACYYNFQIEYHHKLIGTKALLIPNHFTTEEFIETINFAHKKSHSPMLYIPYTVDCPPITIQELVRSVVDKKEDIPQAILASKYYDINGLRNYPDFDYGLFSASEIAILNQSKENFKVQTAYLHPSNKYHAITFSLKDQISAAFTQKNPIKTMKDLEIFISRVGSVGAKVDYTKNDIELVRLAANYGTSRPYIESILYEFCQNAKDAGAKKVFLYTTKLDDQRFIINMEDDAGGIPFSSYLSLSIPFYSDKGSESTGKIGSGFFNVYKDAKEVRIVTRLVDGTTYQLIDVPIRDSESSEILDIHRKFVPGVIKSKKGTDIQIVIEGDQSILIYYSKMCSLYSRIYETLHSTPKALALYDNLGYKLYESPIEQLFLTVDGIPHSPLTTKHLPHLFAKHFIIDLSSSIAGTNQSRTVSELNLPPMMNLLIMSYCEVYSKHGIIKQSKGEKYMDVYKNDVPWNFAPANAATHKKVIDSMENAKVLQPTEYGIRYLKMGMESFLSQNQISMEGIKVVKKNPVTKTAKKVADNGIKILKIKKSDVDLLRAVGNAWDEMALEKGVYSSPVKTFTVANMSALGLYSLKNEGPELLINPSQFFNSGELIKKIKAQTYEQIIEDPDWKKMFSVDVYPSPVIFHELEHHRSKSLHGKAHENRRDVRISKDYFLSGEHTFDAVATEVAKYLFCNGLYDLIKKNLN